MRVNVFKIVNKRIKFYLQNTNLLPPKDKSTFLHGKSRWENPQKLTQNPQHGKNVLVPVDTAANNVVVVLNLT